MGTSRVHLAISPSLTLILISPCKREKQGRAEQTSGTRWRPPTRKQRPPWQRPPARRGRPSSTRSAAATLAEGAALDTVAPACAEAAALRR